MVVDICVHVSLAEVPQVGAILLALATCVCLCRLLAWGLRFQVCISRRAVFSRGDARVGGTEAPLVEPHIAGSSACGGSLWAGGRSGCGDPRDRVLHIGQCEAEWGGWGALGSGRGDAPHQSPCLPSCEGLHGAWCLKLFPEFLLEGGAVHFLEQISLKDGWRPCA